MDESEVFPVQPPQLASDDDYVNIVRYIDGISKLYLIIRAELDTLSIPKRALSALTVASEDTFATNAPRLYHEIAIASRYLIIA